jgi:capsule biosynthesis phosphatase
VAEKNWLVVDLDGTLTHDDDLPYAEKRPNLELIARLREYRAAGFGIAVNTSRNMRTYGGQIGKINANTLPIIVEWLAAHEVPYDEIHVGKPWCGPEGFYVDDRTIRPSEFLALSAAEIQNVLDTERTALDNTRERTE